MKKITLSNGSTVEILDPEVRHLDSNGKVLYDSASRKSKRENIPYFFFMGEEERSLVSTWVDTVTPETNAQEDFIWRVVDALRAIDYDYQIATLEPSFDENGEIFYQEGQEVGRGISFEEWENRANRFYYNSSWYSALATIHEGDLFKAYRIAKGYWTIRYVCDDSSSAGNYIDSPLGSDTFDPTGAKIVGGFKDGVGNTYEVYKKGSKYCYVGGRYVDWGSIAPVASRADTSKSSAPDYEFCSGVISLKRTKVC